MPTATAFLNTSILASHKVSPVLAVANVASAATFALKPANIMISTAPLPASKVKVPVSGAVPSDTEIFYSVDRKNRFYVPRYDIVENNGPTGSTYAMAFVQDGAGRWGLRISLSSRPPFASAQQHKPVEHDLGLTLSFFPGGDQARSRKILLFDDVSRHGTTVDATLWLGSLPERDEVYHAISNAAYVARLTVQRRTQLAVVNTTEVAESFEESALENNNLFLSHADLSKSLLRTDLSRFAIKRQKTKFPAPKLELLDVAQFRDSKGKGIEYVLSVANWARFGEQLFEAMKFKEGNRVRTGSRLSISLVDADSGKTLQSYNHFESPEQLSKFVYRQIFKGDLPNRVLILIEDRKSGHALKSEPIELAQPKPPEKTYTLHWFDFETELAPNPFLFDPNLHANIFAALAGPPPQPASQGLVRHREEFAGTVHSYFQDDISQNRIYYLPDEFRIARHHGSFRAPMVTVRVQSNGSETTDSTVTFDYAMSPYTNGERLVDAAQKIANATGQVVDDLDFQPYVGPDIVLMLERPTVAGRVREDRTSSPLMLQQTVTDTLVMDVTDFQIMFDAMINNDPSALTGWVTIGVDGWDSEVLLFKADFAKLAGNTLDLSAGTVNRNATELTLRNAIESPVSLDGVRVAAIRNGVSKQASGLSDLTQDLAPNLSKSQTINFTGLAGTGEVDLALLADARVLPDANAILNAILDRSALDFSRTIEVQSLMTFSTPSEGTAPSEIVAAIRVDFEGGQTILLTPENPNATVKIEYPFSQVILRELEDNGTYSYRKTVYYADFTEVADTVSTTANGSLIVVLPVPNLA